MNHPYKSRPVGKTVDWLTPPEILKELGAFDLDPCCPDTMPWKTARTMLTKRFDGLTAGWFGRVWLNPPYGSETSKWLKRMADHDDGIALVFARTETKMFFKSVWFEATALLFLRGRPRFYSSDGVQARGNCGGPMVLIAYGKRNAACLQNSEIPGVFISLCR